MIFKYRPISYGGERGNFFFIFFIFFSFQIQIQIQKLFATRPILEKKK